VNHPEWSKNANIYEVNVRQYTKEGTFKAFREHLPRLEKMGVKILWLMPVYPVGKKNRKGELGSYYAVQNYNAVNPRLGTMDDLQALIKDAHERGMKVILDWVANHTAWDHVWTKKHPDWYATDENGNFKPPLSDWSDVIELDYSNQAMRRAMIQALKYWVKEADVDGYRCDVANLVPVDFWNDARKELDAIKPVFMLAESDHPELLEHAFDMSYDFKLYYLMNEIAKGDSAFKRIDSHMNYDRQTFGGQGYRMLFTTNHDENSCVGTVYERLGENVKVMAILVATLNGMPLIYGGQEAGLNKRLAFFTKDEISWNKLPLEDFYTTLLKLKKEHKALWNGRYSGDFQNIETDYPKTVYAFRRTKDDDEVIVVLNISNKEHDVSLPDLHGKGEYSDVFAGRNMKAGPVTIAAHGYLVLAKSKY
jgi:glycosidase